VIVDEVVDEILDKAIDTVVDAVFIPVDAVAAIAAIAALTNSDTTADTVSVLRPSHEGVSFWDGWTTATLLLPVSSSSIGSSSTTNHLGQHF